MLKVDLENYANMSQCKFGMVKNCKIGMNTKIYNFVNLYDCEIGESCMIGNFVEIQKGAKIGNEVRVQSHSFICGGVIIEDSVFIGHGVIFANDKHPTIVSQKQNTWKMEQTTVRKGASIGNNATILPGLTIGENAIIGAGSVVTKNVPENATILGNPGRAIR